MTIEYLKTRINEIMDANDESWATCGNLADLPYFAGFDDACNEILRIIDEEEGE